IPIEVKPANDPADQIFRLLEPLDPHHRAVPDRVVLQIKQGRDHNGCYRSGGDAFHRVPDVVPGRWDAVERVPTSSGCALMGLSWTTTFGFTLVASLAHW